MFAFNKIFCYSLNFIFFQKTKFFHTCYDSQYRPLTPYIDKTRQGRTRILSCLGWFPNRNIYVKEGKPFHIAFTPIIAYSTCSVQVQLHSKFSCD